MFEEFIRELTKAETEEEILSVFYRPDGIYMGYQHDKISWEEYAILLDLVNKLIHLMEGKEVS